MNRFTALGFAALVAVGIPVAYSFAAETTQPDAAKAAKPSVEAVDGKLLKKALDEQKGKVVLLNLWATWCGPCTEEFPDLVKLDREFRQKGLVILGVSVDEPEDKGKVQDFATNEKCGFRLFVRKSGSIEKYFDPIDRKWDGIVPTTYVYDREGKRVGKPLVGLKSYEEFVETIKPLLGPEGPAGSVN